MDDEARYAQAKHRARQLSGFYQHLAMYLLVNAVLVVINLVTSPQVLWFYWSLLGWGIGIVAHAGMAFGRWQVDCARPKG